MLTEQDYINAASILSVEVACIKAVTEVESSGSGFNADGSVKILFEPHVFWKQLKQRGIDPAQHKAGNEDILYMGWGEKPYGKYSAQWNRLNRARAINEDAALCSASYGIFQVMGFHFKICGFDSVQHFVNAMQESEGRQLEAFCSFVKANHLDDELRAKLWAQFALGYNGSGYKKNNYDKKLAAAYQKYSTS